MNELLVFTDGSVKDRHAGYGYHCVTGLDYYRNQYADQDNYDQIMEHTNRFNLNRMDRSFALSRGCRGYICMY